MQTARGRDRRWRCGSTIPVQSRLELLCYARGEVVTLDANDPGNDLWHQIRLPGPEPVLGYVTDVFLNTPAGAEPLDGEPPCPGHGQIDRLDAAEFARNDGVHCKITLVALDGYGTQDWQRLDSRGPCRNLRMAMAGGTSTWTEEISFCVVSTEVTDDAPDLDVIVVGDDATRSIEPGIPGEVRGQSERHLNELWFQIGPDTSTRSDSWQIAWCRTDAGDQLDFFFAP